MLLVRPLWPWLYSPHPLEHRRLPLVLCLGCGAITIAQILCLRGQKLGLFMWLYPSLSKTDKSITALLKVSAAVIKIHDQKQLGKERVYFSLQFSNYTPSLREVRTGPQSKNLVVRTEGKTSEKCCLLACSLWLAQPAFLYTQKWYRPQWAGHCPHQSLRK